MEEFTNEFALARNYGFDITMPDGNMGLSSAAHMEYLNKCQALYRAFIYNMSTIIRFEKETKKRLSKLHREKMDNLRFSLYRSENVNNENDPFAKNPEAMSMSYNGLDSRMNTPWGLGEVPNEEEEVSVRPHTAPAAALSKKRHQSTTGSEVQGEADAARADGDKEEELSTTGLSDPGAAKQAEVILGIIDPKTEKKITVGQHSFARLGNKNFIVKLKNREGLFDVKPLKSEVDSSASSSSTVAFDPSKPKVEYDPVNEKIAMVKQQTNYLSPTIASDMKINNRIPIQKSLKGLDAKRTTVVDIYRNARDRTSRHLRIVTRKQKVSEIARDQRISVAKTKMQSLMLFKGLGNIKRNVENDDDGIRMDINAKTMLRSSSRVSFAREDAAQRDNPSRMSIIRSDSQSSAIGYHGTRDDGSKGASATGDLCSSVGFTARTETGTPTTALFRSDSCLSNTSNFVPRDPHQRISDGAPPLQRNGWIHPDQSFNSTASGRQRAPSVSSVASASVFGNKLKKAAAAAKSKASDSSQLGFVAPMKLESQTDTKNIIKQQRVKDKELDDNMAHWRRRMALRSSVTSSKGKGRIGGGRLKMI